MSKKEQLPANAVQSEAYVKDFFDMVVPSTIKFNIDHFVCGDSFRCVGNKRISALYNRPSHSRPIR